MSSGGMFMRNVPKFMNARAKLMNIPPKFTNLRQKFMNPRKMLMNLRPKFMNPRQKFVNISPKFMNIGHLIVRKMAIFAHFWSPSLKSAEKPPNAAPGDWISTVAGHLLGTVTEEKLFAAASPDAKKEREQKCQAWYFAGMKKLLVGDMAAAADSFSKCVATEQKDFPEYELAEAELKALAP